MIQKGLILSTSEGGRKAKVKTLENEILDNVLSRDIEKQNNKINVEIKEEIKKKEECLKTKKEHGDETYLTQKKK